MKNSQILESTRNFFKVASWSSAYATSRVCIFRCKHNLLTKYSFIYTSARYFLFFVELLQRELVVWLILQLLSVLCCPYSVLWVELLYLIFKKNKRFIWLNTWANPHESSVVTIIFFFFNTIMSCVDLKLKYGIPCLNRANTLRNVRPTKPTLKDGCNFFARFEWG